jgi:DNA polymerase-1
LTYWQTTKTLNTYLLPYQGDDRVHGLIRLGGTLTGRTASSDVSIQNIPTTLHRLFGHPAMTWVTIDVKNAELFAAASMTRCARLLQWFYEGHDPYKYTAAQLYGKPVVAVTDDERETAKAVTLAVLYGGTARTIAVRVREAGYDISEKQAERFRTMFFALFPEVRRWHRMIESRLRLGQPIESPFGRTWKIDPHSWHERNLAFNAPVQSASSDLFLFGVDAAWEAIRAQDGVVVNMIHDELNILVPAGSFNESAWREIARLMTGVDSQFPARVEVSTGPDWGSTKTAFAAGAGLP